MWSNTAKILFTLFAIFPCVLTMKTPWTGRTGEVEDVLDSEEAVVKDLAELVGDRQVLDVGCGPQLLAQYADDYTGVDFEPEWNPDVIGSATALPFESDSFEVVVTKSVLQHTPDWQAGVRELTRVARSEVILVERTHSKPTEIVHRAPVLRRRFSSGDIVSQLSEHTTDTKYRPNRSDARFGVYRGRL